MAQAPKASLMDKLDTKFVKLEKILDKYRVGRRAKKAIYQNPEHVARRVEVCVALDDGTTSTIQYEVLRRKATSCLQRNSMVYEVLSLTPVIGRVFPFLGSAFTGVSALPVLLVGQTDISKAMAGSSKKLLKVALWGFVPGIHSAVGASAAYADSRDRRALQKMPTVAEIKPVPDPQQQPK
jgi:hypothetical protein